MADVRLHRSHLSGTLDRISFYGTLPVPTRPNGIVPTIVVGLKKCSVSRSCIRLPVVTKMRRTT